MLGVSWIDARAKLVGDEAAGAKDDFYLRAIEVGRRRGVEQRRRK